MPELPGSPPNGQPQMRAGGGLPNPGAAIEDFFLHTLGFRTRPGKVLPKPTGFAVTYAAPQPIGFVPPEWYGLSENYFFGLTPKEFLVLIGAEKDAAEDARREQEVAFLKRRDAILAERQRLNLDRLTTSELVQREDVLLRFGAPGHVSLELLAIQYALLERGFVNVPSLRKALAERRALKAGAADAADQFLAALSRPHDRGKALKLIAAGLTHEQAALLNLGSLIDQLQAENQPDP